MSAATVACPGCGVRNRLPIVSGGRPRCARCKRDLPWLTEATADELAAVVESSSVPVLVDLWAPWCGPCRAVAPLLEQLAVDRAGRLRVVKVNVDEAPDASARLGVQGIPTMVLFDGGRETSRQVGALGGPALRGWVDQALGPAEPGRVRTSG